MPNAETLAAMEESRAMMAKDRASFDTADELLADLEKTAKPKRADPPRLANYTKVFLKDWLRLSHSGRYDMARLKEAMLLLMANDAPLGPEWPDHPLKGDWSDHRECHIGGDFLLIYQVLENRIHFVRAGTHSALFSS